MQIKVIVFLAIAYFIVGGVLLSIVSAIAGDREGPTATQILFWPIVLVLVLLKVILWCFMVAGWITSDLYNQAQKRYKRYKEQD